MHNSATRFKPSRLTAKGALKISETAKRTYAAGRLHRQDPATLRRMCEKSNDVTRGSHGFGRQAKGRADHGRALIWTVQAPDGETWTFPNLTEWCRRNEDMFPPCPGARTPTWKRAADGMRTAFLRSETWYGWAVLSCTPPTPLSANPTYQNMDITSQDQSANYIRRVKPGRGHFVDATDSPTEVLDGDILVKLPDSPWFAQYRKLTSEAPVETSETLEETAAPEQTSPPETPEQSAKPQDTPTE